MDSHHQIVLKSNKHRHYYSPFPACFRRPLVVAAAARPLPAPPVSADPDLATSLYHTHLGLFALTWSRNILGRSIHIHFILNNNDYHNTPSFHLHINKPFLFWKNHGSKKLHVSASITVQILWDLSRAKFGSGPEPRSGFYIAVMVNDELVLVVGDMEREAHPRTRAVKTPTPTTPTPTPNVVLRREHVRGINKVYKTRASFDGNEKEISIDCKLGEDPRLCFSVNNKRVLQIKHLKWKFRGNERIEVDGVPVLVSWDVYNWLFDEDHEEDGYALFTFKFEKPELDHQHDPHMQQFCGFGFETKMMKKKKLKKKGVLTSSSVSSSLSSASSSCSSVMEWASIEENELKDPCGFSLLVYAWKN